MDIGVNLWISLHLISRRYLLGLGIHDGGEKRNSDETYEKMKTSR